MKASFFYFMANYTYNTLKQKLVHLSSCEAEYIAITSDTCQGVRITQLMKELTGTKVDSMKILVDNKLAIMLNKNSDHHNRT